VQPTRPPFIAEGIKEKKVWRCPWPESASAMTCNGYINYGGICCGRKRKEKHWKMASYPGHKCLSPQST
jgi:hypothetical protein